jgi:predicted nucleic acid-binding protein
MNAYVDSSLVLSYLLREDFSKIDQNMSLESLSRFDETSTSEITDIECRRTLDRIRIQEGLSDAKVALKYSELNEILNTLKIIKLSPPILKRAKGAFPTVIRTLDAIHVATAALLKDLTHDQELQQFYFLTRDLQQRACAQALGLSV